MTTTEIERYDIERTQVRDRQDWHIRGNPGEVEAFQSPADIVGTLRQFFDALEAEAATRKDDPVAMTHALARMEALLADVRYITATIKKHTADALKNSKVRRLTIDGIATVEAKTDSPRSDWENAKAFTALLEHWGVRVISENGEVITADAAAERMLEWFRPEWRLTPMKEAGLDPDDYSTQAKDEDGKPLRIPNVQVRDNIVRRVAS